MKGKRIAILGLGRSGLSIARAAIAGSAFPSIFDEAVSEEIKKQDVLEEAKKLRIPLRLGWKGRIDAETTDLLVTNPAVDQRSPILRQAVADGVEVISEVEFAYRIAKAPMVALTGTNGKSTTIVMTYLALRECGEDAILCGNIFGSGYPERTLTEAALSASPEQVLVAEISSFGLEWIRDFRPAVAGVTNIADDHLDRYDSFSDYAETKQRIFFNQGPEEYAVIKAYDPQVRRPTGPTALTSGALGEHAKIEEDTIRILDKTLRGQELRVIGTHNLANAAMAGLLSYALLRYKRSRGAPNATRLLDEAESEFLASRAAKRSVYSGRIVESSPPMVLPRQILEGLRKFPGIEHRMERLGSRNGVTVVNNSMCTNPAAVLSSATALKGPNHLLIGGKDKDLDFRPLRHYLGSGRHRAYVYGQAKDVLLEQLGENAQGFDTMEEAFRAAAMRAKPGDIVMLAPGCASTDQFADFRERGDVFRKIAKEWLNDDTRMEAE